MRVTSLHLRRFRNYDSLDLTIDRRLNLIVGDNGQGKTNLLEALYYLSHARSHRSHRDHDLVSQALFSKTQTSQVDNENSPSDPAQTTQVRIEVERDGIFTGQHKLEARIMPTSPGRHQTGWQTQFRLDSHPLKTRSELLGQLVTVSFTLSDLLLFRGTPADRRQWLDSAIVQMHPLHFSALSQCQRLLRQKKMALLQGNPDQTLLAVLNEQLAVATAQVSWGRVTLLQALMPDIETMIARLSDGQETALIWQYPIQGMAQDLPKKLMDWQSLSLADLQTRYQTRLDQVIPQEMRQQQCLFGPQREDFLVCYETTGLAAHRFASQGQQRSLVLALKLAELAHLTRHLGESPVLLLDDVMAELDPSRQALLVGELCQQGQIFLTTTHLDPAVHGPILELGERDVAQWSIHAGTLSQIDISF